MCVFQNCWKQNLNRMTSIRNDDDMLTAYAHSHRSAVAHSIQLLRESMDAWEDIGASSFSQPVSQSVSHYIGSQ